MNSDCFAPDDVWGFGFYEWIPAGAAPTLTPGQLARRALASISLLPADIHIAPNPAGSGLVGLPVWMWTTVNANTWGPISASDSDAGLTVSITAHAVSVAWSMGDGHTVICDNPGTPYEARFGFAHSPTCGHVYEIKSLARPGSVFPVTATTTWQVPWAGGGESGVITVLRQSQSTVRIGDDINTRSTMDEPDNGVKSDSTITTWSSKPSRAARMAELLLPRRAISNYGACHGRPSHAA